MKIRLSHHGDGPRLETSLPKDHPDYALRMEALSAYTASFYAKLIEYARTGYVPTPEGAYRDLFTSVRTPAEGPSLTPEQIANQYFNLLLKVREHEGVVYMIVAPTADANERNLLRSALDETHDDWEAITRRPRGTLPASAVIYGWLPDADDWPTGTNLFQVEAGIFHQPPLQ